jgi:putative transposase
MGKEALNKELAELLKQQKMNNIIVIKTELKPNQSQRQKLSSNIGAARFTYNCLLAWTVEEYQKHLANPTYPKPSLTQQSLQKIWNHKIRSTYAPWWKENNCQAYRDGATSLARAYTNLFRQGSKSKHPQFKKKGGRESYSIGGETAKLNKEGKQLTIPGVGHVTLHERLKQARWLEKMGSTLQEVTLSKDPTGRYYASLRYRVPEYVEKMYYRGKLKRSSSGVVGLDRGLKEFVVASDGTTITNPRYYRIMERKLARAQRAKSIKHNARRSRGQLTKSRSNSERKASLKVNKIHRKIKNKRKEFVIRTAREFVSRNTVIVIEDLNVVGMVKNRKLSKSISDAGWTEFKHWLEHLGSKHGSRVLLADRYYPSSQTCSSCQVLAKIKLTLADRVFRCSYCGLVIDRDLNAALNLKAWGIDYLREYDAARCVESLNGGSTTDLIAVESTKASDSSKERVTILPNRTVTVLGRTELLAQSLSDTC